MIDTWGLQADWGAADRAAGEICLTGFYTEEEIRVGSADEIARELRRAAPGCSFALWEDPKYDWLGALEAYTPDFGEFSAECAANGTILCTLDTARRIIGGAAGHELAIDGKPSGYWLTREAVLAAFDNALGRPWIADWEDHAPAPGTGPC